MTTVIVHHNPPKKPRSCFRAVYLSDHERAWTSGIKKSTYTEMKEEADLYVKNHEDTILLCIIEITP